MAEYKEISSRVQNEFADVAQKGKDAPKWTRETQNRLAKSVRDDLSSLRNDIANGNKIPFRRIKSGDTLGALVSGMTGKRLDYSMTVDYRSSHVRESTMTLREANKIVPGQYVWMENGALVVSDTPPSGVPAQQKAPATPRESIAERESHEALERMTIDPVTIEKDTSQLVVSNIDLSKVNFDHSFSSIKVDGRTPSNPGWRDGIHGLTNIDKGQNRLTLSAGGRSKPGTYQYELKMQTSDGKYERWVPFQVTVKEKVTEPPEWARLRSKLDALRIGDMSVKQGETSVVPTSDKSGSLLISNLNVISNVNLIAQPNGSSVDYLYGASDASVPGTYVVTWEMVVKDSSGNTVPYRSEKRFNLTVIPKEALDAAGTAMVNGMVQAVRENGNIDQADMANIDAGMLRFDTTSATGQLRIFVKKQDGGQISVLIDESIAKVSTFRETTALKAALLAKLKMTTK